MKMKKIVFSSILAIAMLFACEKDASGPATSSDVTNVEISSLKSAVDKNAVIIDQVKESLRSYFDGMENRDWDLMRSLVTQDYYVLEQGELFDVEGHINWLQEVAPPPVTLSFTFDYVDILVKGTTAWMVYYDFLDVYVGETVVGHWEGLESAVFLKSTGEWKLAMLTATEIPQEQ
jgi:hypothetical protein